MTLRCAKGVVRARQPVTKLSVEVSGITKVVIGSCELQQVGSWDIGNAAVFGRPTMYAEKNGGLIFWPTPDQTYAIDVYWDGHIKPRTVIDRLPEGWFDMYIRELNRAKEAARGFCNR